MGILGWRKWRIGELEEEDCEGSEGGRGVWGEESGGERIGGGLEKVGEALENGHLVDELVDVGDVVDSGEADAGEEGVAVWGGVGKSDWGGGGRWRWGCSCHFLGVFGRFLEVGETEWGFKF